MAKYSVGIVMEFEVDENNYLHWEEQYESEDKVEPRTKNELMVILQNEYEETIWTSLKRNELFHMISIDEVKEN